MYWDSFWCFWILWFLLPFAHFRFWSLETHIYVIRALQSSEYRMKSETRGWNDGETTNGNEFSMYQKFIFKRHRTRNKIYVIQLCESVSSNRNMGIRCECDEKSEKEKNEMCMKVPFAAEHTAKRKTKKDKKQQTNEWETKTKRWKIRARTQQHALNRGQRSHQMVS